ncbi:MAG: hypothetical protein HY909_19430 [Deltaproteobacteria bacterium]|nr:hypothetical protein [Deltaproteobacteria bacterium]
MSAQRAALPAFVEQSWRPWLRATLRSPHPTAEVRGRLAARLPGGRGPRCDLLGEVTETRVTLWLPRANPRALAPVVSATLRPDGGGTALDLTVRFPWADYLFLGLGHGLAVLLLGVTLGAGLESGRFSPGIAILLLILAVGVLGAVLAFRKGARELLERLVDALEGTLAPPGSQTDM